MVVAPRQGIWATWNEKRSFVSQETLEDCIGVLSRSTKPSVSISHVAETLQTPMRQIKKAIAVLERKGYLTLTGDWLKLTEPGQVEAARLIRAHRLWEKYLQTTGTPESELHLRAHQLEHITDQTTMDYLDDRLGHPWIDPHGSVIPADRLPQGKICTLSVLREGAEAEIQFLQPTAAAIGLQVGQRIHVGPRMEGADSWTIDVVGGTSYRLNHEQADGITVRLIRSASDHKPDKPSEQLGPD